jgi:proline dehydrogenase
MDDSRLSFENTANAFAYRNNKELRKAAFLFQTMNYPLLVRMGTALTPWVIKARLPVRGIIRNTLFQQFVGGETLEQTAPVVKKLGEFGVNVILDYGVEGKQGEDNFEHACEEFVRVVEYASKQPNIPYISIKVTGLARFELLEKLDAASTDRSGYKGFVHTEVLNEEEKAEWERVVARMEKITAAAAGGDVGLLVDAEESWIQDPVDAVTMQMMQRYNRERIIVYNTVQLYRSDRLHFLQHCIDETRMGTFTLGVKLVRGAYMDKERKRAEKFGYASPIQPDKDASDRDYNEALRISLDNIDNVGMIIATHNEESNLMATRWMKERGIEKHHAHVHFSQLYGMSDHITFNLARAGYSVSKYVPFGPIEDVIPYLMRRAQENSSVSGQTGRELSLIRKEIARRREGDSVSRV